MSTRIQQTAQRRPRRDGFVTTTLLLAGFAGSLATHVAAQEAIGVPFTGGNHLSFYTTELSRDGIGDDRAAVFGGVYGHRFGSRTGALETSLLVRAGARSFGGTDDGGILDGGVTLAATKAVAGLERLSVTAAAGVGAVAWGQGSLDEGVPDTGRLSVRVPVSAGVSYDLRAGRAIIAPFAAVTTAWSRERDYVEDERIASDAGWRVGSSVGVSVRFQELVLSVSELYRERGMPNAHRFVFSAGMSW